MNISLLVCISALADYPKREVYVRVNTYCIFFFFYRFIGFLSYYSHIRFCLIIIVVSEI